MNASFYVYALIRPDTGDLFYVGKGHGRRMLKHGAPSAMRNDVRSKIIAKLKRNGLEVISTKLIDGLTEREALDVERAYIEAIGRIPHGPLVNLTDGGEGATGYRHRPETIEKLRGRPKSDETKRKISDSLKGKRLTEEHRAALRAAVRPPKSDEARRKLAIASTGRRLSEDARLKISLARQGTTASAETRAKMSAAHKGKHPSTGYKWTEEQRLNLSIIRTGRRHSEDTKKRMSSVQMARRAKERAQQQRLGALS